MSQENRKFIGKIASAIVISTDVQNKHGGTMGNMSNRKLSFLFGEIFARGNNNDDSDRTSWNGNRRCGNEEQQ